MPSGGARTRSGPPPDPNALARERDGSEWVVLPAQGRVGDLPKWPLVRPLDRELELWRRLWKTPQAAQWEILGQDLEVALYVRRLAEAELPGASSSLGTLVRQLSENLGLSIPGMLRLRWHLGRTAAAPATDDGLVEVAEPAEPSSRSRFKVIRGEAAGA
jgi:hypothetical protein